MFATLRKILDTAEDAVQTVRALNVLTELDALVDDRISTVLASELEGADLSDQVTNEVQNLDLPDRDEIESTIDEKLDSYFRWDRPLDQEISSEIEDQMDTITDTVIEALGERLVNSPEFREEFCGFLAGKVADTAEAS